MTEQIEKLEHGLMICAVTGTELVHIKKADAEKIRVLLQEHEAERLEFIEAVARLTAEIVMLKDQDAEVELCDRCGRARLKSKWEGR